MRRFRAKDCEPRGSNGRIAVPLALIGADVTIFDISSENKRHAMELAACAGVELVYEVCDFCEGPMDKSGDSFDIACAEGGILHYFHDIDKFMSTLCSIQKSGGKLILSHFHPFRKILRTGLTMTNTRQTKGYYFDSRIHNGDLANKQFFSKDEQIKFPDVSMYFYTVSEMVNAMVKAGFALKEFNEHPNFEDKLLTSESTIYAAK